VSGGPDSLALLCLAQQQMAGRIVAATVDHQLRAESAAEAEYVAAICQRLRVDHVILQPAQKITGNIQSSARAARYALLEQAADRHDCHLIATAHHGDDQLETLLMRLARGSGVDGLSAIRFRNGRTIRPLLQFSKSELEEICVTACLEHVRDPSNDDTDFDRVALRSWLKSSKHPFDLDRVGATVSALQDASAALNWMTDRLSDERIFSKSDEIQCDATGLPRELQRRLLLACVARFDPELKPRGEAIDRLLADLQAGKTTTLGDVLCTGGTTWRFSPAPPRRKTG
jgi:tRNA(Ile)-lysidine synthase